MTTESLLQTLRLRTNELQGTIYPPERASGARLLGRTFTADLVKLTQEINCLAIELDSRAAGVTSPKVGR